MYIAGGDHQDPIGGVFTKDDVFQPGPWEELGFHDQFPDKRPTAIVFGRDLVDQPVLMVTVHPAGGIARKVGDGPWTIVPDPRLNTTPNPPFPWTGMGASYTRHDIVWVPDTQLVYFWDISRGVFRSSDAGQTVDIDLQSDI